MGQTPPFLPRLFAELKRRKVFRVMAAYGVIGFGVIEVADAIFPRVALPDWTVTLVVWLTLLGFPIAVILAWAFESTPEGVKRTEDATPEEISEIIAQPASRRWMPGLLALAGAALLFGGWWMGQRGSAPELNLSVPEAQASDLRKIAVLPFDDLGGNAENQALLRNFHESIIAKLTALGDLRVTSPFSASEYANSPKDSRQIADELAGVDHLLRGSVSQAGGQAQIHVWLEDVAEVERVPIEDWTGEVTVDNIFTIQSEIARRVAERLEAQLSPQDIEHLEADLSTKNPAAINAYYKARSFARLPWQIGTHDLVSNAERAVELAPEFVEAWSLLARGRSLLAYDRSLPSETALDAVERTEALAPESFDALMARGWYARQVERDFPRALTAFRAAARMAPSNADVLSGIVQTAPRVGEFGEASEAGKRAVRLDPLNPEAFVQLAVLLADRSDWDAANEVLDRALAIDPSSENARYWKVWIVFQRDLDPSGALRLADSLGLDPREYAVELASLAVVDRDYERAGRLLDVARPDERDLNAWRLWHFLFAERVESQRGGNPQPFRDSLAAFFVGDPALVERFKHDAATARLLNGQEEAGWRLLGEFVDSLHASASLNLDPYWRAALVYARFGRTEEALDLLDEVVGKPAIGGWWSVADLKLDPRFDSLRDDPRFDALIARQEAYEEEQARLAEAEGPWLP
jgi:TolB-like protein